MYSVELMDADRAELDSLTVESTRRLSWLPWVILAVSVAMIGYALWCGFHPPVTPQDVVVTVK